MYYVTSTSFIHGGTVYLPEVMSWSTEEVDAYQSAMFKYNKDFFLIAAEVGPHTHTFTPKQASYVIVVIISPVSSLQKCNRERCSNQC